MARVLTRPSAFFAVLHKILVWRAGGKSKGPVCGSLKARGLRAPFSGSSRSWARELDPSTARGSCLDFSIAPARIVIGCPVFFHLYFFYIFFKVSLPAYQILLISSLCVQNDSQTALSKLMPNSGSSQQQRSVRQSTVSSGIGDSPLSSGSSPVPRGSRSQSISGGYSLQAGAHSTPTSNGRAIRGASVFRLARPYTRSTVLSMYNRSDSFRRVQ